MRAEVWRLVACCRVLESEVSGGRGLRASWSDLEPVASVSSSFVDVHFESRKIPLPSFVVLFFCGPLVSETMRLVL